MLYKNFFKKYMNGICRDCLRQISGLRLSSEDCVYNWKADYCAKCNDYRYIPAGLRFRGRLKVLFYKDKNK